MAVRLVWRDYVRRCYAWAKESEAKLVVGKLEPPWLENTLFLLDLFSSKTHLLLFPSRPLHPHARPPLLSSVLLFSFLVLLLFLPLSLLRCPVQSAPSVNSSFSICCFFFLHLHWPPDLLNSCVTSFHFPSSYSHTHPSLLGFLPLCLSDVFLILTLRLC